MQSPLDWKGTPNKPIFFTNHLSILLAHFEILRSIFDGELEASHPARNDVEPSLVLMLELLLLLTGSIARVL